MAALVAGADWPVWSGHQADAEALPFDDATFDRVTSKLGAMYFTDIQLALSEIRRVLRPGGRVALACWGPAEQSPSCIKIRRQRTDLRAILNVETCRWRVSVRMPCMSRAGYVRATETRRGPACG